MNEMNDTKCLVESDYSVHTEKLWHSLQVLRKDSETADITFICDDLGVVKGHKLVLAAFSSVLSTITRNIPGPSAVLYLKGINSGDMNSILDFMYYGKVTIDKDKVPNFFELGKHLNVELLSEFESDEFIKDSGQSELTQFTSDGRSCPECDNQKIFKFEESLRRHVLKYHEHSSTATAFRAAGPGKVPCQLCSKTFGYTSHLRRHMKSVHEGRRFKCNYCDHTATQRVHLRIHIKSKHANEYEYERQENENESVKFKDESLET